MAGFGFGFRRSGGRAARGNGNNFTPNGGFFPSTQKPAPQISGTDTGMSPMSMQTAQPSAPMQSQQPMINNLGGAQPEQMPTRSGSFGDFVKSGDNPGTFQYPTMTQPGNEAPIFVNNNPQPQQTTPPQTTTPAPVVDAPPPEYPGTQQGNPWDAWTPQQNIDAATVNRFNFAMQNPAAMPAFFKSLGVMFADQPGIDWSKVNTTWMQNLLSRAAAGIGSYDQVRGFLQNQVNNLLAYGSTGNPNNPGNGPQQQAPGPVEDAPAPEIPAQASTPAQIQRPIRVNRREGLHSGIYSGR